MYKYVLSTFFLIVLMVNKAFAETKEDYAKVFRMVKDEYLNEFSLDKFAVAGILALNKIDKDLKIFPAVDNFGFIYSDGRQSVFMKPKDLESPEQWGEAVEKIVVESAKYSPQIQLHDFELFDVIIGAAFKTLDEFSKYYPSIEDEDNAVQIKKYFGFHMEEDILYIKLKTFNKVTFLKTKKALEENSQAKGLIVDLRGNSGGMLSEAIKVADLFLDEGSLIVSTKGKGDVPPTAYIAKDPDSWEDKPIVIIVDAGTASSAEMFAVALKEQGRAMLIGTKTFGKGTVQNLKLLNHDKGFALTNAYYYSPQEKSLHKQGIDPDVCLSKKVSGCGKQDRENKAEDIESAKELIKQYL